MRSGGRRRRRKGRRRRLGDRLEEAGSEALLALWRLVARVIRLILAALARAWKWFRNQGPAVQGALWAGLALLFVVSMYHQVSKEPDPVYLDSDAESLARVIRSEIGTGTMQQRLHVAWATRNLAAERDESIAEMACSPCGPQQAGRPVSSRQPAKEVDRELARAVLNAPDLLDPTGGATHFINPRLQDELAKSGSLPGYKGRTYRRVRRQWKEVYGWEPYYRLGPELEFWGNPR